MFCFIIPLNQSLKVLTGLHDSCSSQIDWSYSLRARNKTISDVLNQELQAIKEKVKYMNITIEKNCKKKKKKKKNKQTNRCFCNHSVLNN